MSTAIDSITWGTQLPDPVVTVYFVPQGASRAMDYGESYTSEGFNAYEKSIFMQAFNRIAALTDLTFQIVTDPTEGATADFQMVLDTNEIGNNFLGVFNPPEEYLAGHAVFNGLLWDRSAGGSLEQGGFDYVTVMHEILHGLGLAHPHDDGGTSTIMAGVTTEFGDYGTGNLNQGVFTTMSYNSGYLTAPIDVAPQYYDFGHEAGPMALDIAVLQSLYGAGAHNTGNNVYVLPSVNKAGTMWRAIWDTAGEDEIRYNGGSDTTIDLRPATSAQGSAPGGYVSAAAGIAGGVTVAKGVLIENATGGSAHDRLIGNWQDNHLVGRGGHDQLVGSVGDDRLEGGAGRDTMFGGLDKDQLFGGFGHDKIYGSWGSDIIYGNMGGDTLNGGGQRDLMWGGGNADVFDFNAVSDSRNTSAERDVIFDFQSGLDQLDMRTIDADATRGGNQAFDYIWAQQFTDSGQVRVWRDGADIYLLANTDNNFNTAEFAVELRDCDPLRASDFLL